jgi:UDP-glucose 4-epimerase
VFVDDVVEANAIALTRGSGETVNLGTGVGTSVLQIVRELQSLLGFDQEPIFEAARPGVIQRIWLDASRARDVLGWAPRVAFRDGLQRTVEWSRLSLTR